MTNFSESSCWADGRDSRSRLGWGVLLLIAGILEMAAALPPRQPPPRPLVAITFDDLPFASAEGRLSSTQAAAANRQIVRALRRARVPATGFVSEARVEALGPAGRHMLAPWNAGLLELGNHGYSHADSNAQSLAEIEREVLRGEATIRPMSTAAGRGLPFFRFPYNHVGDTEPKRQAIEALLARHGYRLAAATIDTSDWLFNRAYERARDRRDRLMLARIERAYLDHSRAQIRYYAALGRKVLGRDVPAILLLHLNQLNAAVIRRLLRVFEGDGYGFVSLAQAQADPAFAIPPAVATRFGPMWAYRWARERHIAVDGSLESEPPGWITEYGNEPPLPPSGRPVLPSRYPEVINSRLGPVTGRSDRLGSWCASD